MENLAEAFDAPENSREHRVLAESAWMGGPLVSVRYYLGRLIGRNLFRVSDDEVLLAVGDFVASEMSAEGASLFHGSRGWGLAEFVVRCRFETLTFGRPSRNPKEVQAVEAFLTNPSRTTAELATLAKTTEKQVARMSTLGAARALARLIGTSGVDP